MTTYTAIANGDIDSESPINVTLMTLIRDNPIAITEGSSGAPKIQLAAMDTDSVNQAAILAGAVHQGELSTGTEEETASGSGLKTAIFTSPGGYGFFPEIKQSGGGASQWITSGSNIVMYSSSASYGTQTISMENTANQTMYVRIRYVASSPPYDLGDGEVGRFVYSEMEPNGDIARVWNSDDPPWRMNITKGPRRYERDGTIYTKIPAMDLPRWGDCVGDENKMDGYVDELKNGVYKWVKLDNEMKIAPMSSRPSPWAHDEENTVVMVDPACDLLHLIAERMKCDEDLSPAALLHQGYLKIDNTQINRRGPPGVPVHGIRWK